MANTKYKIPNTKSILYLNLILDLIFDNIIFHVFRCDTFICCAVDLMRDTIPETKPNNLYE